MDTMQEVSSVSKYLKKKDMAPVRTGVSRYLLKQSIVAKNSPALTGVAKYTVNLKQDKPAVVTTVSRYLNRLELEASRIKNLTGVAKYQAEKDRLARKQDAAALIARYIQEEARAAEEKSKAAMEAASAVTEPTIELDDTVLTTVEKYAQRQAKVASSRPAASSVAKYLAKLLIEEKKRPPKSGVDRYITQLQKIEKQRPQLSGVSRYVKAQAGLPRVYKLTSGVAKYLVKQDEQAKHTPLESKVAKYLAKQELTQANNKKFEAIIINFEPGTTGLSRYIEKNLLPKTLEGEFIPAGHIDRATGVDKYLNSRARLVS
jgi:hypothetical protein